ncbi:hypothetical protein KGP17_17530 [Serratia sp. JSRIV001]|uniref:hypothetical protein n=1 Tax=Serratia sp. JSRIV001 TaxID=2831893 RepID=UPI001CBB6A6A|nr:hypothetical protein [Serratia sp. JSRIV001]UAN44254.1 hypothetical protein KGP17_17530 [Serratia sp. JSRIV001]
MQISIFKNTDNTVKAKLGTNVIALNDFMNDKNEIKNHVNIADNKTKKKVIALIENASASLNEYSFNAGFGKDSSGDLVFVACNENFTKAVMVSRQGTGRYWKNQKANLTKIFAKTKNEVFSGDLVENKKVEFVEDKKLSQVAEIAERTDSKLSELEKRVAELEKELSDKKDLIAVQDKIIEGEGLEASEEFILFNAKYEKILKISYKVNATLTEQQENDLNELLSMSEVNTFSNSSLVFSLTKPAATINEPLIVCSDQSARTNRANFYNPIEMTTKTLTAREMRLTRIKHERLAA